MEYILDMNKWVCGDGSPLKGHSLGKSTTHMLNDAGEMCCLGQFASQCSVGKKALHGQETPKEVAVKLNEMKKKIQYDPLFVLVKNGYVMNTPISKRLMKINDSQLTTVNSKVKSIKRILEKAGHSLVVIPLKEK